MALSKTGLARMRPTHSTACSAARPTNPQIHYSCCFVHHCASAQPASLVRTAFPTMTKAFQLRFSWNRKGSASWSTKSLGEMSPAKTSNRRLCITLKVRNSGNDISWNETHRKPNSNPVEPPVLSKCCHNASGHPRLLWRLLITERAHWVVPRFLTIKEAV